MTVSDITAATVREVRKRRGWQPADLAARCADLGATDLTENVIENIESRSRRGGTKRPRSVTVDELMALGRALDIAPVYLLTGLGDDGEPYPVTETISESTGRARQWIRGTVEGSLMRGVDRFRYLTERPDRERGRLRVTEESEAE
jgi:transcriptional regulator with XRE-family HTH domain